MGGNVRPHNSEWPPENESIVLFTFTALGASICCCLAYLCRGAERREKWYDVR